MELREFRTELPSTQTEAVRRAREGAPNGTRVVAQRQTAGQGRGDHRWESPEGNLYLSLVVRSPTENRTLLPLAVGARLRAALDDRYEVRSVLKWPNDLLVLRSDRARKLAGILVDVVASPTLDSAVVVGIGLNVRASAQSYPPEVRAHVISLSELTSLPLDLTEVEELAAEAAESAVDSLSTPAGVAEILAECRTSLHGVGCRATVDSGLSGIIRSLGDEGELWLDTPSGAVAIRSGDLAMEST
jgi:BirA family transcriptional regulator, biotin operon repressor / biotin---[acetyl-CoA-carboxylase] ligase